MSSDPRDAPSDPRKDHALRGWVTRGGAGTGAFREPPGRRTEIRLARRLVEGAGLSFVGQLLLAGMTGLLLWGQVPPTTLVPWLALVVAGAVVRYIVPGRAHPAEDPARARRLVRGAAGASASAWAVGPIVFAPLLDFGHLALLMVVFAGMVAAAVNTMSADPPSFHAFGGVLLGALVVALLRNGLSGLHAIAVTLVVLFGIIVGLLVAASYRTLRHGVETSVELAAQEAQAERESSLLTALMQSVPDAIVVMHRDGRVLGVNQGFEDIFGWASEEALGRDLNRLVVPDEERERARELDRLLVEEGSLAFEVRRVRKDGEPVELRASAAPVRGVPDVMVVLYHDITRLKATEGALEQAKEEAEAANRAKSRFLATMSHEIRTPMNAIIGMAELLAETELSPEQKDYVQVFRTAGDTLLGLINEVLDLSKIEAGHLELHERDVDLPELADRTVQVFAVPAHEKGLELTCHVEPDVPRWVRTDPDRLRQVLVNLLGNAVKFTEEGEVVLTVRRAGEAPSEAGGEGSVVGFEVRDTGPGISEDRQDAIFERFTQADATTSRTHGGTGLGLTISRALVHRMGGTLILESEPGRGSRFRFRIPLEAGEPGETDQEAPLPADVSGLRTLVVDDNATNRLVLREILVGWGARVETVAGGREALDELEEARDEGIPYDLVLLDGQMPEMDGFQVAEAIRDHGTLAGVTVMMLTSTGDQPEHVRRARAAGVDSYLVKPIRRARLLQSIRGTLGPTEGDGEPGEPGAPPSGEGARILLAEDTEENRMLVEAYLDSTPHSVRAVENGEEAVAALMADPGSYDLVFMDLRMPVMDGYEATRRIRAWEEDRDGASVAIVALTAHAMEEERRRGREAGCDAHLTKPIKKQELLDAVARHARRPGPATSDPG